MSKAEELREALDFITVDCADMGTGDGRDICAVVCDTLGITRAMVDDVMHRKAYDALTTLLEVAGR